MQRFQKLSKKVADKLNQSKAIVVGSVATVGAVAANAAVTMPAPDYTDIEQAAGIGFAIVLTVGLLMKAKRFFR